MSLTEVYSPPLPYRFQYGPPKLLVTVHQRAPVIALVVPCATVAWICSGKYKRCR